MNQVLSPAEVARAAGPAYPPVELCELRPYANGYRYWVQFTEKWQPPQTTQKRPPKKKEGIWLTRCTTILNELNKHNLYGWYSQKTAEWFRDRLAQGWTRQQLLDAFWQAVNEPKRARDDAAEIGRQAHRAIEEVLETGFEPDPAEMRKEALHAYACWQDWWQMANLTPIATEKVVYSLGFDLDGKPTGYGGTVDLLARNISGQHVLVDWKTSGDIHTEHLWQLAAYAKALGEMGEPVPELAIIVRIPKNLDEASAEWTVAWETPAQLARLQLGFTAFCHGLQLRPKSVKLESFGDSREVSNADGLFEEEFIDPDQDDLAADEAELNDLFTFR